MSNFDNTNQVVLSKVVSDNPNAPALRVRVELEGGRKMKAGLWPMTRKSGEVVKDKNGNTLYKGTLEVDDYQAQGQSTQCQQQDEFDDGSIPF